jgi:hypothetical protein
MSAPAPVCPNCQSEEVEKLISVPGGMSGGDSGVASCGAPRSSCSSGFS